MGRKSLDPLKEYLSASLPERAPKHPGDPADEGPVPPIPDIREPHELKSREEFISRLRTFYYPYRAGNPQNKKGETFFVHLQSLGLLDAISAQEFTWHIRMVWFMDAVFRSEKHLKKNRLSYAKYSFEFHQKMMQEIFNHR